MFEINQKSLQREKKYDKLLNNLLDIKGKDQCLFTKVNGTDSFDITSKFGEKFSKKILMQKKFSLLLSEIDLEKLLEVVENSNKSAEIIEFYEKYKEKISITKKILLEDSETFLQIKEELIEKLKEKIQKTKTRWHQYKRKILDLNIQENIWPLHIATFFVSIKTTTREIYAPLILKEVNKIEVIDSKIIIYSEDSWKINEKLLFILNENGYIIDEKIALDELNGVESILKVKQELNLNFNEEIITKIFESLKKEDVKNKILIHHPGVILGLFKPSGGNIRKTMQEIINNNEIDEIIDTEPDKNIYKNRILEFIQEESEGIIRIQKSNFSQDKAIISSLIQDTIIWGPPGTGKSQVIANIIANILYKDKTAIVMSQKKAALDVLKKRLGAVYCFVFFILNDNKMDKEQFYKPLVTFTKIIENTRSFYEENLNKIISKEKIEALDLIAFSKKNDSYYPSLKIINILQDNYRYFIKKIFSLDQNLIYPTTNLSLKNYVKELAKINSINKKGFLFIKYYPKYLSEYAEIALDIINNIDFNINDLMNLVKKTDYKTINSLLKCVDIFKEKNEYKSNEKYLINTLSSRIIKKINNWKSENFSLFNQYKKFANAVYASRRLPHKFLNDHTNIIQELFPVIVTTPETSFINWKKHYFDYSILDESSQMFLEIGLPILYLSKIKVLAGDNKQMQPSRWFSTRDDNESDEDVTENANSVLDYSFDKGVYQIMLDQNFRSSSAALMSFSAKNFYDSNLDVIDKKNQEEKGQSIIVHNVNGKWDKSVNKIEAEAVIKIVLKEKNNYENIIILTFNSSQRQLIEKMIIETQPELYSLIESENLAIRNIENIQGDEADLVVISVVYDETTNMISTYVARSGGKNALNVSISRAKEKMIVVKSIMSSQIKNTNATDLQIFKNWLEFLDISESEKKSYSTLKNEYNIVETFGETDSNFEREIIDEIKSKIKTRKLCKLAKQYEVGSKKIDIAFLNEKRKYILGIEVDGYKYHDGLGFEKHLEDLSREEFLEFKGYNIYRIKEIDWKINKKQILFEINQLLNKFN